MMPNKTAMNQQWLLFWKQDTWYQKILGILGKGNICFGYHLLFIVKYHFQYISEMLQKFWITWLGKRIFQNMTFTNEYKQTFVIFFVILSWVAKFQL